MSLIDTYDGWIIDLDGVVWVGDRLLPGAAESIARLRGSGARVVFLTNDPRSSPKDFAERLTRNRIATRPEQVITSGAALAALLGEREEGSRAYVIGSPSLHEALADAGLALLGEDSPDDAHLVAVGGHEGFHYRELQAALRALEGGAALYATNRDPTYPAADGPRPGTGAVLAAVETAAERRAVVAGKPESFIFELARARIDGCQEIAWWVTAWPRTSRAADEPGCPQSWCSGEAPSRGTWPERRFSQATSFPAWRPCSRSEEAPGRGSATGPRALGRDRFRREPCSRRC